MLLPAEDVFQLMNTLGSKRQAFLFGIDFNIEKGFILDPDKAGDSGIYFNINGVGNHFPARIKTPKVTLVKHPVQKRQYKKAFDIVHRNLIAGNLFTKRSAIQVIV